MDLTRTCERGVDTGALASVLGELVERAGLCVQVVDLDGTVLAWSGGCERLYGCRADDVVGCVLPHVPEDRRRQMVAFLRSAAASGRPAETESIAHTADGWRAAIRMTALPLMDADGHPCAALVLVREALGQETGDVVKGEAAELIGRLFSEPLGSIANAAMLLERAEVASDPEQRSRLVARVRELAVRARDLLDDLRLATGEPEAIRVAEREPVDIGALAAQVASRLPLDPSRLLIDFALGSSVASVDRLRVERAIEVALREATDAACEERPVEVSVRPIGASVVIDIGYVGRPLHGVPGISDDERGAKAVVGGPRRAPVASVPAWTGMRYVDTVVRAHGGRTMLSEQAGSRIRLTLALPRGNGSPVTTEGPAGG